MFAQPKPILPGVEDEDLSKAGDEGSPVKSQGEASTTEEPNKSPVKGAAAAAMGTGVAPKPATVGAQMAAIPKIETAWERGLRQAKEMKRRSQQRKVSPKGFFDNQFSIVEYYSFFYKYDLLITCILIVGNRCRVRRKTSKYVPHSG